MSRRTQLLTVLGCVGLVLAASSVQMLVVLDMAITPVRLLVPVGLGALFGLLLAAVINARAVAHQSAAQLEAQRQEIAHLNEQLSRTVRLQGHELKTARSRLLETDRLGAVGLLAGGLAHDFNNLLTVVLSGAAFLNETASGEAREVVEGILSAGERGATLTNQLLALARPPRETTGAHCLNRAVEGLEPLARRLVGRDIALAVARCPGSLTVPLDRSFVEQLLLNLVVNARDAMSRGGTLTLTTERQGPQAVLKVRDTGAGMSPEVQARIFEPFFTTKGEGRGTGLGLAVVMDAVQRAGGQISIDSRVGAGTTFVLTFPLVAEALVQVTPPNGTDLGERGQVVFAEEEANLRRVTTTVLEQMGYQVSACAGQADALAALEACLGAGQPVILVTDLLLGDGDGQTLVHEARRRAPHLPTVLTSSLGLEAPSDATVALAKPYSTARLVDALLRATHRARPDGGGATGSSSGGAPRSPS